MWVEMIYRTLPSRTFKKQIQSSVTFLHHFIQLTWLPKGIRVTLSLFRPKLSLIYEPPVRLTPMIDKKELFSKCFWDISMPVDANP